MKIRTLTVQVLLSLLILPLSTFGHELPRLGEEKRTEVAQHLGKPPAFFIENQGQMAEEVKYYFKGNESVYFTDKAVVFQKIGDKCRAHRNESSSDFFKEGEDQESSHNEDNDDEEVYDRFLTLDGEDKGRDEKVQVLSYCLEFLGANPTHAQATNQLETKANYFIGNDPSRWHTKIPTYQEIVYPGLYGSPSNERLFALANKAKQSYSETPNYFGVSPLVTTAKGKIDLIYKGAPSGVKYEFIVHPGADPNNIRLAYTGIEGLSIDDAGNLLIHTALGDVKDEKPYVYQEIDGNRVPVDCKFIICNMESGKYVYGFEVASYNKEYPLVIDPGLEYSTFLGGSNDDKPFDIAIDTSGNAYVYGLTLSSNFPTTAGAYDTSYSSGFHDTFVAKFDSTGSNLIYSTFLGGSDDERTRGLVVDGSGNAYLTGNTWSSDFPTTPGAYDTTFGGNLDAFVTKLDSTGSNLIFSTFLGGSKDEYGRGIAIDSSNNVYATGWTHSSNFPITPGAYDTSFNGTSDTFVTKFNSTGSDLLYSTFVGGSLKDMARYLCVDNSDNAYVTGSTDSTDFPTTPGAYVSPVDGTFDVFVIKLNSTGSSLIYSSVFGGSGTDHERPRYMILDSSGNAYISGITDSVDFPTTPGAYDTSYNGGPWDTFVTKLNPTGSSLVYSTFLGGAQADFGWGIAVDSSNNAYVSGSTNSGNFPTTPGAFDTSLNGAYDAFISKLDSTGSNLLYSTFLGGTGGDGGRGIVLDNSGNVYLTGWAKGNSFPTTPGAYDTSYNGGEDAFVAKLLLATSPDTPQWEDYYDAEGTLEDWAKALVVSNNSVCVVGRTETAAGGSALALRVYNATTGVLSWARYYNREGNLADWANAVAVSDNRIFMVGRTETAAGGPAFSVRVHNISNGALLWQNHYNREGALTDEANAVVISTDGTRVYVVGRTETTAGGPALTVRAYNTTTGSLSWARYYNREGNLADWANAAAISGDRLFMAGRTETAAGGPAFTVRVLNASNGTFLWQNIYNMENTLSDEAYAVIISPDGTKVFASGKTETTVGGPAFAVRAYNASNGILLWVENYNREGSLPDEAKAIAVSPDGTKVFAAGKTESTAGGTAFAVRAYNASDGTVLWHNNYDREGTLSDEANGVAVSPDGTKVFVVGKTETTTGGSAFTLMEYDASNGTLLRAEHYDKEGSLSDEACAVAANDSQIFVVGKTQTSAGGSAFSIRTYAP